MIQATMGKLKGKELRPAQIQAIEFIRASNRRFIAIRGDTGVGKTCFAFEAMKPPFFYVCNSIQLQEQAEREYPDEATLLKGRGNYFCETFGTADLCVVKARCGDCLYDMAKNKAFKQYSMTILNFHYFLSSANFTSNFPIRNIIIDEADTLDNIMVNFIAFDFQIKTLAWLGIVIARPTKKTKIEVMPAWLKKVGDEIKPALSKSWGRVSDIIEAAKERSLRGYEVAVLRKHNQLKSLKWKVDLLLKEDLTKHWIYHFSDLTGREAVQLKPKWLSRELADRFLFNHGNRFLLMSATLPAKEVLCGMFQLKADEVDYLDLPAPWENQDRKVIYTGSYEVKYKSDHSDGMIRFWVKEILDEEKGRGIIHTVNYKLSKLMDGISERILTHGPKNKKEVFQKFIDTPGAVFASPSSARGLDLPDELCEFIIVLKAPFLQLGDPHVNARLYGSGNFGKIWYTDDAIRTIIQMSGRGYRHEKDKCTIYLGDKQIGRLLKQSKFWPMQFRDLVLCKGDMDV